MLFALKRGIQRSFGFTFRTTVVASNHVTNARETKVILNDSERMSTIASKVDANPNYQMIYGVYATRGNHVRKSEVAGNRMTNSSMPTPIDPAELAFPCRIFCSC